MFLAEARCCKARLDALVRYALVMSAEPGEAEAGVFALVGTTLVSTSTVYRRLVSRGSPERALMEAHLRSEQYSFEGSLRFRQKCSSPRASWPLTRHVSGDGLAPGTAPGEVQGQADVTYDLSSTWSSPSLPRSSAGGPFCGTDLPGNTLSACCHVICSVGDT